LAYIFVADSMGLFSLNVSSGLQKTHLSSTEYDLAVQGHSRSSKDNDFGTNRKRIYDFLLVIYSNYGPILHRF